MMYSTARLVAARTSPGMKAGVHAPHLCNDNNMPPDVYFASANSKIIT